MKSAPAKRANVVFDAFPQSAPVSAAEQTLRTILAAAPVPVVLFDLNLNPLLFSQAWAGEAVAPSEGRLDPAAWFADPAFFEAARRSAGAGSEERCQIAVEARAGRPHRWFQFTFSPWPSEAPHQRVVASGRDVTAVVEAAREAEAARALLAAALANLPHGLAMFDADWRLILCNDGYGKVYGLPQTLLRPGTSLEDIIEFRVLAGSQPKDLEAATSIVTLAAVDGEVSSSHVELADGRTIRVSCNPISTGGYVSTHEDVTESLKAAARIEFLAYRDTLTGLPNRAAFQQAYDEAVASADQSGEKFGLIMVDVDHFKAINDTLGHDAGDALLKSLAGLLAQTFRRGDTVARLGGDEFAVVLRGLKRQEDMTRPIQALQALLRTPIAHAGQSFTISTSLGAAFHDDPDADPNHLLKNADVALYQAKYEGRNRCVVFAPAMRTEVERRVELLRDIRQGLAQGEFVMFYQPVVDIAAHAVVGFEALMRWNHPDQGVLAPATFMAAFEDNDLALQLGEVAFESALGQMRAWLDEGVEFGRVAVNVSAAQFRSGGLAGDIADKLARWRVPADRLTIEVTENVYMGWGAEIVAQTVRDLHDSGVMIALDDFGTGYASLANLRQFPIDRLKIDKSFVQDGEDDAIVRAVINLGASLGMKVVAEGVERVDQLEALTGYGCDQVQGYHFARPMPAGEVAAFTRRFRDGG